MQTSIYHIPRCFMNQEPSPQTAESIAAAKAACEAERAVLPFHPRLTPSAPSEFPTEDDFEKLAAQDGLYNLIRQYGAQRVMQWVRNLAAIAGQEVV